MRETKETQSGFYGTYFEKDSVLRLAALARIFAWVVLVIYALQWLLSVVVMLLQVMRGFWVGLGTTDMVGNILYLCENPLRGVVYFIVLQTLAKVLLIYLDMEDNTRRTARNTTQE